MSKDIEEKKLKKEKKDKKEKRAEKDGVTKSKKDKKEKKIKGDVEMTDALEAELEKEPEVSMVNVVDGASGDDEPRGALVPFAFPLADNDKEVKKILKTVKKCTSHPKTHSRNTTFQLTFNSRQVQDPPPWCQRSRQGTAQIRRRRRCFYPQRPQRHCRHCCRHLAHGRHCAHPCPLRRPQRALHLHQEPRATRRG